MLCGLTWAQAYVASYSSRGGERYGVVHIFCPSTHILVVLLEAPHARDSLRVVLTTGARERADADQCTDIDRGRLLYAARRRSTGTAFVAEGGIDLTFTRTGDDDYSTRA
jgi:hypothetical protein